MLREALWECWRLLQLSGMPAGWREKGTAFTMDEILECTSRPSQLTTASKLADSAKRQQACALQSVVSSITTRNSPMKTRIALATLLGCSLLNAADKTPAFRAQDIDTKIEIGYGLAIADVDGDGKPDILLVDAKQIVWYQNPTWTKHVIAENLTVKDHVCIAARDIDGDGKCEIAVGAEWNPGDTVNSGAVFYLIPPADRTQKWEPVKFPSVEPTTHRMKWVRRSNNEDGKPRYDLVVVPLHGRGNKNGEGAGVKVLAYQMPKNSKDEWKSEVISDDLHMTHNFDIVDESKDGSSTIYLGGKEGVEILRQTAGKWQMTSAADHRASGLNLKGVGEIRHFAAGNSLKAATIEPMHGTMLAIYTANQNAKWERTVLDSALEDGHAVACADLLGLGRDQIVVGWRAMQNKLAKVGIKMFVSDEKGEKWTQHLIDDNLMSCEDLMVADLNGDGKPDIIASGRRTKNVKIYWNESK